MALDTLGSDFGGVEGLDANLEEVDGNEGLIEELARRLSTDHLWYDRSYGYDLRNFIGTTQDATVVAAGAERECRKDERVKDIRVTVTKLRQTDGSEELDVDLAVVAADGPFVATLKVSSLTVQVLRLEV